ncbi:exonuclease SbcCD subunit D [Sporosarcina sp. Marseille-Q4063]|uniref:exonuclease SbcCD subunit D n=1 Tax=Sporosarcina sp. Marseille-Q4063 TaxID=2810514 RepID=UPI001BAFE2C6|nr:exonuclease SbcCD subunit D [Sporosarcina sp. Marseille-Q4063]QUW22774.1 exonuclease SbcCD subunit D [Sporosarcina sp. Marseille-Q4063]
MKFFHTADWHLGKLVQGVYMTDEQRFILNQFIEAIEIEKPDAIVIAGDLYDRAVPPTEAVALLDEVLEKIVMEMKIPVIAIGGNHDSPGRLHFGSTLMQKNGYFIAGQVSKEIEPVILQDEFGEVNFHLVPFADPSVIKHLHADETISNHQDAMKKITDGICEKMDGKARHVFVGHAFVTPHGESEDNTSDSERPIAIGGAEYVSAHLFDQFHYTALGHLHQAHYVLNETIRYAGSPLKYSISEEHHNKGFFIVELDAEGNATVEKRELIPNRDMRTVEGTIEEIQQHPISEDYVFVKLLDETPVLFPMEKIRSVYPNAMHVERKMIMPTASIDQETKTERGKKDDIQLFTGFYKEMMGAAVDEETKSLFEEVLYEVMNREEG